MNHSVLTICIVLFAFSSCLSQLRSEDDWRRWRGPQGNGITAGQTPPIRWSETENVVWKVKVPGRGHASPIIVNDRIFLATAEQDNSIQSVVCYDRSSGKQLWQTPVSTGEFNSQIHPKNTHASPTIATDGDRVFAVFNNHGSIQLTALDLDGTRIWKANTGQFEAPFPFGYGASPIVYEKNVIVTNLNDGSFSGMIAYDGATGKEQWRTERPAGTSYSTPVVATVAGKEQLLLSGTKQVFGFDPANGKKLWDTPAQWSVSCGTMVWNEDLVFASGGYPAQQTLAVKADGSGEKVWENAIKVYEQSMLYLDGYLYAHSDNGGVYCSRGADGKEMWKQRFGSGREPQSTRRFLPMAISISPMKTGRHWSSKPTLKNSKRLPVINWGMSLSLRWPSAETGFSRELRLARATRDKNGCTVWENDETA